MSFNDMLQHPSSMLYIFADDAFLAKLDSKTASIIRKKRANQYQLLAAESGGYGNRQTAAAQISAAFEEMYGMKPGKALVVLAQGGEVAGKNWAAGVYGVGAIKRPDFSQNSAVTVNSKTGEISVNGTVVQAKTIYGGTTGKKIQSYIYTDANGNTYTSQKMGTKYYAGTYTTSDGKMENANGQTVTEADSNSLWTSCGSIIETVVNWLMSLFGGTDEEELITADNTLASQGDGFVETTSASTPLIIAAAAVGTYLYTQKGKKKSKK